MFFDTLSGIAERYLPEFLPRLQAARLFRMEPRDPDFSVGEVLEAWEPDQRTIENFRLPFPVVAFENVSGRHDHSSSCVILSVADEATRRLDFLVGIGSRQSTMIAAGALLALPDAENSPDIAQGPICQIATLRAWEGTKKTGLAPVTLQTWWIDPEADKVSRLREGRPLQRIMAKQHVGDETWEDDLAALRCRQAECRRELRRLEANLVSMHCVVSILSVLTVNDPAQFIVEERPLASVREPPTLVPRSAGRPHYIVLRPRQIRERFIYGGEATEDGDDDEKRKMTPHERRGHFRRLQSDRFRTARGQVLWIKPMWIGPSEAVRGRNRYKVMLEL